MNELTMNLKTDSKVPLYEQIYNYIKSDIQNGRISYGEKLPPQELLPDIWKSAAVRQSLRMNSYCQKAI